MSKVQVPAWITAFRYKGRLDVMSTMIDIPFAELKAIAISILNAEVQHEMADRQRRG